MKKVLALLLSLVLVLSFAVACGNGDEPIVTDPVETGEGQTDPATDPEV